MGTEYPAFLQSYQQPPRRGLRRNPLKCGQPQLEAALPFALEPTAFSPLSYAFAAGEEGVGRLPAHHAGLFYVQEPSACSAVTVAGPPARGEGVGFVRRPGGKSTQIAGLLAGGGAALVQRDCEIPGPGPALQRGTSGGAKRCGVLLPPSAAVPEPPGLL